MVISKSSLWIEKKDKSSVREILKREFGRLLWNLKKEIQVKNNQTTTKETISDNKSQSKQEIWKQNFYLITHVWPLKFFRESQVFTNYR